jgi:chemotaxis signal transduction protein
VILAEFPTRAGQSRLVGLVARDVSHVVNVDASRVNVPTMMLDEARYLGAVLQLETGLVQLVSPEHILTERLQDALYGSPAETD